MFFSRKEKGMKVCTFFFFQGVVRSGGVFVKLTNITPVYCLCASTLKYLWGYDSCSKKEERNVFPLENHRSSEERWKSVQASFQKYG